MNTREGKETLGQRLQRLRREAGLTQAELADRSGQSLANLRNWEHDHRTPGLWAGLLLARALGVALEVLAECAEPDPDAPEKKRVKRTRMEEGRPMGRPPKEGRREAREPDGGQEDARRLADAGQAAGPKRRRPRPAGGA